MNGADAKPIAFGEHPFTNEETNEIAALLNKKLDKNEISYRQGPGGQKVAYLESWRAIELANEIFGYNGWSSSIINLSQDYIEDVNGKISCGVSAVVRVQLKDGCFHEDVGYGSSDNQKSKSAALEKAKKEAVSDALKRCMRLFGNHLGNSVYDKEHLKSVKNQPLGMITQGQTPVQSQTQYAGQVPAQYPQQFNNLPGNNYQPNGHNYSQNQF